MYLTQIVIAELRRPEGPEERSPIPIKNCTNQRKTCIEIGNPCMSIYMVIMVSGICSQAHGALRLYVRTYVRRATTWHPLLVRWPNHRVELSFKAWLNLYITVVSHKDWKLPTHKFDWLKSILTVV